MTRHKTDNQNLSDITVTVIDYRNLVTLFISDNAKDNRPPKGQAGNNKENFFSIGDNRHLPPAAKREIPLK